MENGPGTCHQQCFLCEILYWMLESATSQFQSLSLLTSVISIKTSLEPHSGRMSEAQQAGTSPQWGHYGFGCLHRVPLAGVRGSGKPWFSDFRPSVLSMPNAKTYLFIWSWSGFPRLKFYPCPIPFPDQYSSFPPKSPDGFLQETKQKKKRLSGMWKSGKRRCKLGPIEKIPSHDIIGFALDEALPHQSPHCMTKQGKLIIIPILQLWELKY